ncbi:MAG: toll/interleukin-1 receptor domain-containing protein [Terricaulis sp.]
MHLFISHATKDAAREALALAQALEALGNRCWIAPRDVRPGIPYPRQIVDAVEKAQGLVLLVSRAANDSADVLQEVQLAAAKKLTIAPVVLAGTEPGPDLRYYVSVRHQIAWTGASAAARALGATFESKLDPLGVAPQARSPRSPPASPGSNTLLRWVFPAAAAAVLLIGVLVWSPWRNGPLSAQVAEMVSERELEGALTRPSPPPVSATPPARTSAAPPPQTDAPSLLEIRRELASLGYEWGPEGVLKIFTARDTLALSLLRQGRAPVSPFWVWRMIEEGAPEEFLSELDAYIDAGAVDCPRQPLAGMMEYVRSFTPVPGHEREGANCCTAGHREFSRMLGNQEAWSRAKRLCGVPHFRESSRLAAERLTARLPQMSEGEQDSAEGLLPHLRSWAVELE